MKKTLHKYNDYAMAGITTLVLISSLVPQLFTPVLAASTIVDKFVTSGTDTSGPGIALTPADLIVIGVDDSNYIISDSNWPNSYQPDKYIEYVFSPGIPSDVVIDSITITHKYKANKDNKLNGAKLQVWDGVDFSNEETLTTASSKTTFVTDVKNVSSYINTPNKINGIKIRFLANGDGAKTRTDFVKITITYSTIETGTITIVKDADPNDPQDFEFTGDLGTFYLDDDSDEILSNQAIFTVATGTYNVTEIVPSGWDQVSAVCNNDSPINAISVSVGENVICTFTNNKLGTIIVEKQTDPDNAVGSFTFTGNANGTISDNGQIVVSDLSPGTYTSTEEDALAGFDLTSIDCDDGNSSIPSTGSLETRTATFNVEIGETIKCTFNNRQRGSITVQKVADPSSGEFQFNLIGQDYSNSITIIGTDSYTFENLIPQNYSLSEIMPEGWTESNTPSCDDQSSPGSIDISAGEDVICIFNNTQYGTISGVKFNDTNGNGERDDGEPGIENWQISLYDGEVTTNTNTDQNGNYIFTNLLPTPSYSVSETSQEGWTQTAPGGQGTYNVPLSAGQDSTNNDFGNFKYGRISGYKFEDTNSNGIWDDNEYELSEWTINLFNGESTSTTDTDEDGYYEFSGLSAGEYTVSEELQPGWVQTTPSPTPTYSITVLSGTDSQQNNFGNSQSGKISGYKFEDVNGNGVQDEGDFGLYDWTINLFNGASTSTTYTDQMGYYEFAGLPAGEYIVSETGQE